MCCYGLTHYMVDLKAALYLTTKWANYLESLDWHGEYFKGCFMVVFTI